MKQRNPVQILFSILLLGGMILSMVQPAAVTAQTSGPQTPEISVDPQVLEQMASDGAASYWIDLAGNTELASAEAMGWSERGWFVYEQLSKTAELSQASVVAYLKESGIKFKSFWIKNTILVTSSDLAVLNGLMSFPEIEAIRARRTYQLHEPDTRNAVLDNGVNAVEPNLTHINADDAWALGYTGLGITVANIDTGVRYTHDALVNQYRGNQGGGAFSHDYNWFDPYGNFNVPTDGNGHGTHTMGTMVGDDGGENQIGIAPGADWMACRGCDTSSCSDFALLTCAEFVAAPTDVNGNNPDPSLRPDAVNNSWGDCDMSYNGWYQTVVDNWQSAGIYPIFSNGNASNCGYPTPPGLGTVGNPARYGNVTGVGSSGEQNGEYASHSNWGPSDVEDTINAVPGFEFMKPQVLAPGVSIRSSTPGSDSEYQDGWTGTSMSAPHVTGLVALMWQAAPCLVGDYATTEVMIEDTAVAIVYEDGSPDTPGNDPNYATGWGEIDALAAVQAAAAFCGDSTLDGTVTDAATSLPLAGAQVTITSANPDNNRTVFTNADGYYNAAVFADTYDIAASKFGYTPESVSGVVVTTGSTVTTDFALDELPPSLVSGFVYEGGIFGGAAHGYPLYSSLTFSAPGFSQTVYTDPFTGAYEIELYLNQEYNVTVAAVPGGYAPFVGTFTPDTDPDTQDYTLFVDVVSCAAPGYQPDYEIYWDFETSDGGFVQGGTTSFAWGEFTSGPGEGHSGTKGLATNPGGDHSDNEDGYIISPPIDLTGFGTDTPALQYWEWRETEFFFDFARVDVTKDGGATWTTVWGPESASEATQYTQKSITLDPTYNVVDFQFRFYFTSDGSVTYAGWYIDDIGIARIPLPPAVTVYSSDFETDNGGFTISGDDPSWEHGAPTSGPGAAHSGANVWATNLSGNYNNNELSYITSPVIDLSAHTGLTPTISFWHWMDSAINIFDWGAVEATNDGGATWNTVWEMFGNIPTWSFQSLALDPSYAVSNFQFRFHLQTDASGQYPGWYIDDVEIRVAEDVSLAVPCVPVQGGVVAGTVFDGNTLAPLTGATVTSDTGIVTETFAIPEDPIEGFYWLFQPTETDPEAIGFTASMEDYSPDSAVVSVAADAITRQDFTLSAGVLEFDPLALEATMTIGDPPASDIFTITNNGDGAVNFELRERNRGFVPLSIPAFRGTLPQSSAAPSLGRDPNATASPLGAAQLFDQIFAGEPAFAIDIFPGENLVHIPDTTAPGNWDIIGSLAGTQFFAGDFTAGDFSTLYVADYGNNNLYAVDTATAAVTLIGPTTPPGGHTFTGLTGEPDGQLYGLTSSCGGSSLVSVDPATGATTELGSLPGIDCGIDLAYNTNEDMLYIVDIITDSLFRVDPASLDITLVGSLGFDANFAQGLDFEEETGILYWAAYGFAGELRVIDMTTGASALIGGFPGGAEVDSLAFTTGGSSDVPWFSEAPVSGVIAGGSSQDITVTFDPAPLPQPGDYLGEIRVGHDTPYTYPDIALTLHLQAPASWGTFNGTVNGLERCDVNPAALEGSTVNIYDSDGVLLTSLETNELGYYSWSLLNGTYDLEVIAAGYVSQTIEDVVLGAGATVITNFNLRLNAPCLGVDPGALEQTMSPDRTRSQVLTINNTGAGAGSFNLLEMDPLEAAVNADVELILDDGSAEDSIGLTAGGQFLWFNRFTPNPTALPFFLDEVLTLFNNTVQVGDEMQLVVYSDADGDPSNGATYLGGESFTVVTNDLATWNSFTLADPIMIQDPGDVLIGFVNRSGAAGTSDFPAAIDMDSSQQRSWVALYSGDPPAEPPLPSDGEMSLIDDAGLPGNWNIRGMGTSATADILWLEEAPVSGSVAGDSSSDVTITFDSAGLDLGDYFANLRVRNAAYPPTDVPVTLHVIENALPIALDDAYSMLEEGVLSVDAAAGPLANDTDPLGDPLTVELVDDVSHGTLVLLANGFFVYVPVFDFTGVDTFTYRAFDGEAYSLPATVSITVNEVVANLFLPGIWR